MKFGKQLKLQSVPEWQESYISYKRLKRVIKKLVVQLKEQEERHLQDITRGGAAAVASGNADAALLRQAGLSDSPDADRRPLESIKSRSRLAAAGAGGVSTPGSSASVSSPARGSPGSMLVGGDAYQEFWTVIEADLDKINRFYASKLEELTARCSELEALSFPRSNSNSGLRAPGSRGSAGSAASGFQSRRDSTDQPSPVPETINVAPAESSHKSGGLKGSIAAVSAWMRGRRSGPTSQLGDGHDYGSLERGVSESDRLVEGDLVGVHTISTSAAKRLEERLESVLDLYRQCLHLQVYSLVNYEGLRKIVKKLDKNIGEEHSAEWVARLDQQPFRDTRALLQLLAQVEDLYTKLNCRRPNQDIYSSQGVLRAVKREVDNPKEEEEAGHAMSWLNVLLALGVFCAILLLPILPHDPRAKSCAALLGLITVLWVTEAVPFFVAALCIPLVTVLLGILADPTGVPLTADKASKAAFGFMFNDTIMLIIGGFSISAAFSKCNFELRLAAMIQRRFGDSPKLFLLAFMLLGAFLSCWISNIAAPLLLTSLLLPIVRDFGSNSAYSRALLLGLAFSANIGGMMSPISSPQNAIALGYLEQALPHEGISFTHWLLVSVPFCVTLVLVSWAYLCLVLLPECDVHSIPMIVYEKTPLNRTQLAVIGVSGLTVVLWCTLAETKALFGEMGTIAVLPAVVFFGSGILTKQDLLGFSWNLILLIGGGNVLGAAVNSSQLLHIISQALEPYLAGHSPYATTFTVLLAVFLVTTFVSHTVAALILTPIIVDIAAGTGQVQIVLMTATLMMSGAMSLPMSSFPNANSLLVDDDFGRPFLHPLDYLKHGTSISVACFVALCTLGYALCYAFLDHSGQLATPIKGGAHHGF